MVPPDSRGFDRVAARGWVDLRPARCGRWIERAQRMVEQAEERAHAAGGSGSDVDWSAIDPDQAIAPASFVKWVFRYEDGGERIKR